MHQIPIIKEVRLAAGELVLVGASTYCDTVIRRTVAGSVGGMSEPPWAHVASTIAITGDTLCQQYCPLA